jgi:hypothetical protein
MKTGLFIGTTLFVLVTIASLPAQPPFQLPNQGQRLPDDNVEGTIFEYKCTPKKKPADGAEAELLEGQFRIEGSAVFTVNASIKLPSPADAKRALGALKQGKAPVLKAPGRPQQKRIGEYRKLSGKKRRFDFDDEDSLNGLMIVWPKKNTRDVWMGTYKHKQSGKVVQEYSVIVRPIED